MVWFGKNWLAWKAPLLWMAFGGGLLFLSIVLTFPYGALQARVIGELHRATGMDVRAADWAIGLPAAIEWRQMTLTKADWPPLQLGLVRAQVGLWQLLTGGVGLDLATQLDETMATQGTIKLTVTAAARSMTGPVALVGTIQTLDLSKVIPPYVARGILGGEFTHRLDYSPSSELASFGEGTWKAEVKDLSLDHVPIGHGRILALAFSSLSIALACREQVCEVTELKGDGIDGSFSGQGTVTMQQPIQQSQVALSLTVIPGVGFAAKAPALGIPPLPTGMPFTFKVIGTLAQARVAL